MDNNRIVGMAELMSKFANIDFLKSDRITTVWKKVVSKIHVNKFESEYSEKRLSIGERLAGNTRVVDLKNGILLVEADHPGWIQYLRTYQKFILKGLKYELPDLKINSLAFRLAGTNVSLKERYENQIENEKNEFYKKVEEQENLLNKNYPKSDNQNSLNNKNEELSKNSEKEEQKSTLPPEILAKFDSIRNSILTNSKF